MGSMPWVGLPAFCGAIAAEETDIGVGGTDVVAEASLAAEAPPVTPVTTGIPGTTAAVVVAVALVAAAATAAAFATAAAAAAAVVPTPNQPCRFFKCRFMWVVRLSTL